MRARALNKYVIDIREVVTHCELWKTVLGAPAYFHIGPSGQLFKICLLYGMVFTKYVIKL